MTEDQVRQQLERYLEEGNAHASLSEATSGIPPNDRCRPVEDLPYTLWGLLEHIRIAQWDIVEFCKSPDHSSPEFPDGYWPEKQEEVSGEQWEASLDQIKKDKRRMIDLIRDPERKLTEPFPWGDGQTLQKEAQLIIDHRSYHTGQIIVLRRMLGNWDEARSNVSV